MESVRPSFYGVKGPSVPEAYKGTALKKTCKNEENLRKQKDVFSLRNLSSDDWLLIGLLLLLIGEKNDENYIMLLILAMLLFD